MEVRAWPSLPSAWSAGFGISGCQISLSAFATGTKCWVFSPWFWPAWPLTSHQGHFTSAIKSHCKYLEPQPATPHTFGLLWSSEDLPNVCSLLMAAPGQEGSHEGQGLAELSARWVSKVSLLWEVGRSLIFYLVFFLEVKENSKVEFLVKIITKMIEAIKLQSCSLQMCYFS